MNDFQKIADGLRKKYAVEEEAGKSSGKEGPAHAAHMRRLEWGRAVLQGFVDDLAEFSDPVKVREFVTRRRDRLTADKVPSAPACDELLRALSNSRPGI